MIRWLLLFLLIPSLCWPDSELTVGGKTAQAHLISSGGGNSLTPRPYLDFEGCTATDVNGKTVVTCSGGGGGGSVPGVTSLWSVSPGNVGIFTGSPNNNQNVGINTISPQYNFQVNGSLEVSGASNVGIGSLAPGTALDVQGTIRSSLGAIFNGNVGIGSTAPGSTLDVNGTVNSIRLYGNVGIGTINSFPAGVNLNVNNPFNRYGTSTVGDGQATVVGTQGNELVLVDTGGNGGSNYLYSDEGSAATAGQGLGYFFFGGAINSSHGTAVGAYIGSQADQTFSSSNNGAELDFATANLNANTRTINMVISPAGNVGISSLTPGMALDVKGTVRSTLGFQVGTNCFYRCVGGVDAGVIQTSACNLCPGGSCTLTNICGS